MGKRTALSPRLLPVLIVPIEFPGNVGFVCQFGKSVLATLQTLYNDRSRVWIIIYVRVPHVRAILVTAGVQILRVSHVDHLVRQDRIVKIDGTVFHDQIIRHFDPKPSFSEPGAY